MMKDLSIFGCIVEYFRDRPLHLKIFLHRLHTILRRQQYQYQIFVIQQVSHYIIQLFLRSKYTQSQKKHNSPSWIFPGAQDQGYVTRVIFIGIHFSPKERQLQKSCVFFLD